MQRFHCICGNVLFFGSSRCLSCSRDVGYDPQRGELRPLIPGDILKPCANGPRHAVCNWLLPASDPQSLCLSCRLNRTIPDTGNARNTMLWARMEMAKRRLLFTLLHLGIPLPALSADQSSGLAFDIVSTLADPTVTTGHLRGVITVNLEEADDTYRQFNRQQLGESSRTLLGHFRHESGHYLWYRHLSELAWDHPHRVAFRELYGNEADDYAAALTQHYERGAPSGWEQQFITPYAASHPWEDWAETWAHYLQIVDGLETCESLGIHVRHLSLPLVTIPATAGTLPAGLSATAAEDGAFLASLQRWICLSSVLNEISQSLGEPLLYPFVISVSVARKLRLAHHLAGAWRSHGLKQ